MVTSSVPLEGRNSVQTDYMSPEILNSSHSAFYTTAKSAFYVSLMDWISFAPFTDSLITHLFLTVAFRVDRQIANLAMLEFLSAQAELAKAAWVDKKIEFFHLWR